jgi:hypothetical protein
MEGWASFSLQEFPSICAVEAPRLHGLKKRGIEVPQVHAMTSAWLGFQWLPVSDASTGRAADRSQSLVTLDVLVRVLWVASDSHCAELIVGPRCSKPPANGAIATCCLVWRERQFNRDGTAVTGSYKHEWTRWIVEFR